MGKPCDFCKDGICYALACYDGQACAAKDKDGHPEYADTEECKAFTFKLVQEGGAADA